MPAQSRNELAICRVRDLIPRDCMLENGRPGFDLPAPARAFSPKGGLPSEE
jgi:hypothetical protein